MEARTTGIDVIIDKNKLPLKIGNLSKSDLLRKFSRSQDMTASQGLAAPEAVSMMSWNNFDTVGEQEIQIAPLKLSDMGFTKEPKTKEIYDQIKKMGLRLVPAEVGPQLVLQKTLKDSGDYFVATNPLYNLGEFDPRVFWVINGTRLAGHIAKPKDRWRLSDVFVVGVPQTSSTVPESAR